MKHNLSTHMFNASYIAIALYGARRILRKINPITFDGAMNYLNILTKKTGDGVYLGHENGSAFLVAYIPENFTPSTSSNIRGAIAASMSNIKGWRRVMTENELERLGYRKENIVSTPMSITKFIPPEYACRIPTLALALKRLYGDK